VFVDWSVKVTVPPVLIAKGLPINVEFGAGIMLTVAVPDICEVHKVVAFVAKILNVVLLVKGPVGKMIELPVPATGLPTAALFELFLSW
jgi:hypothetical protein